jgi:hypothetical protein
LIDADVVQEYIEAQPNRTITPRVDGRLSVRYTVRLPVVAIAGAARPADVVDAAD